jgi:hypothetical protein
MVLTLVQTASADVELSLRGEGRSTVVSTPMGPSTSVAPRANPTASPSVSATPRLALVVDTSAAHLVGAYSATIWVQDVGAASGLLVNHMLDVRAESGREGPWRAAADVGGVLGMSEPLTVPPAPGSVSQYASTAPIHYEALHVGARGEHHGDRNTLGTGLSASVSSGIGPVARTSMPLQRSAGVEASAGRLATERDTLTLSAGATRTWTDAAGGAVAATSANAIGTWRRGLSPTTDGWMGAGASLFSSSGGGSPSLVPSAEVGLAQSSESVRQSTIARVTIYVDRFTGRPSPMALASWSLTWTGAQRWGAAGTASVGANDSGTVLASVDLRTTWTVRERLALEAGALARWQRDPRPEVPSFLEVGVFLAVSQANTFHVASGP